MTTSPSPSVNDAPLQRLADFLARHERVLVLTGAGISTGSGIPDYRDENGQWKRPAPMQFNDFVRNAPSRQRYWARSMVGWPRVRQARPNAAHHALREFEASGLVDRIVTQNVDGLHQRAGSAGTIDLHGRLDEVQCLDCRHVQPRETYQRELLERNPGWAEVEAGTAPDGDADLAGVDFGRFDVAPCPACGGVVKPRVVFFGESIPAATAQRARAALDAADALLIIGSSLMVFSGFRFARTMAERGQPIALINRGRTRADDLIGLKIEADITSTLQALLPRTQAG